MERKIIVGMAILLCAMILTIPAVSGGGVQIPKIPKIPKVDVPPVEIPEITIPQIDDPELAWVHTEIPTIDYDVYILHGTYRTHITELPKKPEIPKVPATIIRAPTWYELHDRNLVSRVPSESSYGAQLAHVSMGLTTAILSQDEQVIHDCIHETAKIMRYIPTQKVSELRIVSPSEIEGIRPIILEIPEIPKPPEIPPKPEIPKLQK